MMQSRAVFDLLAQNYDAEFTSSQIGRLQRNRVWYYLTPLLNAANRKLSILEINCGTGEDALQLGALGHSVMATDAAPVMIEKAKSKLNALLNSASDIQFETCAFSELPYLCKDKQFDLIFSNFAGLNCIPKNELEQLCIDLAVMVKPAGYLFMVLLSPYCLREIFYYGIRGRFKTAFRRLKGSARFTVNDHTMPVYYYAPGKIRSIFSQLFTFIKSQPVGLFIPPSYLEYKFINNKKKLDKLDRLEAKWHPSFLSSFADHFCIIFKKTATSA